MALTAKQKKQAMKWEKAAKSLPAATRARVAELWLSGMGVLEIQKQLKIRQDQVYGVISARLKVPTKRQCMAELRQKAKELPKEVRQQVIDLAFAGERYEKISATLNISVGHVTGVILLNTYTVKMVRRETV